MKTSSLNLVTKLSLVLAALAFFVSAAGLQANTLQWQIATGIWDFNNTVSFNGSTPSSKWTNNTDTLLLNNSGVVVINVTNGPNGQVGAYSVTVVGGNQAGNYDFTNQLLQIGAGGVQNAAWNGSINFTNNLQLTAAQTWTMNNKQKAFVVYGNVSGSGTTPLIFDALNYNGQLVFDGANTFTGAMTVQDMGNLLLDYGAASQNNSKLDSASALVLSNSAAITWQGGSTAYTQAVSGLTINGWGDFYLNRAAQNNVLNMGAINRTGVGSTLRFGQTGSVISPNPLANGIFGGWATTPAGWAYTNDATGAVLENQGLSDLNPATGWTSGENVNWNGALVSAVTSRTINTLRLGWSVTTNYDLSAATLTLAAGGIFAANNNPTLTDGFIQSGLGSGELFVWASQNITNYAVIQDNGGTPTILVKAGANTLVLGTNNTYTGTTYVNQGTLLVVTNGNISTNTVNVAYNGTLSFNRADSYNLTNTFNSYGIVQNAGTGTLNLNANNSVFGMPALNNTTPGQVLNTTTGTLNFNLGGSNTLGLVQNSGTGKLFVNALAGSTNTFANIKNNWRAAIPARPVAT